MVLGQVPNFNNNCFSTPELSRSVVESQKDPARQNITGLNQFQTDLTTQVSTKD